MDVSWFPAAFFTVRDDWICYFSYNWSPLSSSLEMLASTAQRYIRCPAIWSSVCKNYSTYSFPWLFFFFFPMGMILTRLASVNACGNADGWIRVIVTLELFVSSCPQTLLMPVSGALKSHVSTHIFEEKVYSAICNWLNLSKRLSFCFQIMLSVSKQWL